MCRILVRIPGTHSYKVEISGFDVVRRHIDQLEKRDILNQVIPGEFRDIVEGHDSDIPTTSQPISKGDNTVQNNDFFFPDLKGTVMTSRRQLLQSKNQSVE